MNNGNSSCDGYHQQHHHHHKILPKRIILVRHGESQGNKDDSAYVSTPDHKIPLTDIGVQQAQKAGLSIRQVVSDQGESKNWKVYFYVSPYDRTRSTLREIGRAFSRRRIIGVREECRIREQDFGNFQVAERMKVIKETREKFGRFFYRFPEGESAADVFDRVSNDGEKLTALKSLVYKDIDIRLEILELLVWASQKKITKIVFSNGSAAFLAHPACFLESLWRDIDMNRLQLGSTDELNLIIISHGLAIRVFLMKWFKWTVGQFEYLSNLENCEFRVMQLGFGGDYSLALHHSEEEMLSWGLSPEMIQDQRWRAHSAKGDWYEKCPWYLDGFFDNLAETDDSSEENDDKYGSADSAEDTVDTDNE